jgi:hypothetical protein
MNLNDYLNHTHCLSDVNSVTVPLADELIHLRGIAADMVQTALATGEDVHQQFHQYWMCEWIICRVAMLKSMSW